MIMSEKQIMQLISLITHAISNEIGEIWKDSACVLIDRIEQQQSDELKIIE